jgi:hypothetical protein
VSGVIFCVDWQILPVGPVISSSISWRDEDPAAITLAFLDGDGQTKSWVFARDLVQTALWGYEAGEGDVRMKHYSGAFFLVLDNGVQTVVLRTNEHQIYSFLMRTYAITPLVSEEYNIDRILEGLLSE